MQASDNEDENTSADYSAAHKPEHVLRILEVETFGRGGLTHYVYNLSRALAARGHKITLATAATYELEDQTNAIPNVAVARVFARGTWFNRRWLPQFVRGLARKSEAIRDGLALAAFARRSRPDVIHLHCTNPISLFYLRLLTSIGVPVVFTAHVVTPHEKIRFQNAVYRRLYQFPHLIIAHSEFDRQRLLNEFGVDAGRVTVIPHGEYGFFKRSGESTDRSRARERFGLGSDDLVALFFGYIREYKGLDLLLEAWPTVQQTNAAARLLIAGDPVQLPDAHRDELETWATRVGAIHQFNYIPLSEVPRFLAASDVLVMPYRRISQSGVLFLALSLGVPVVATRVGGIPETLDHGETAWLVPPESPSALADGLHRVLGDPDLRSRLSEGGRRVAEKHSWESIANQTEVAFAQMLTSGGQGTPNRDST